MESNRHIDMQLLCNTISKTVTESITNVFQGNSTNITEQKEQLYKIIKKQVFNSKNGKNNVDHENEKRIKRQSK
jgi:hypothetical protein